MRTGSASRFVILNVSAAFFANRWRALSTRTATLSAKTSGVPPLSPFAAPVKSTSPVRL